MLSPTIFRQIIRLRTTLLILLLGLASWASAQTSSPYYPGHRYPYAPQQQPQNSNTPGSGLGSRNHPYQQRRQPNIPSYKPIAQPISTPSVEVLLSNNTPYLQENLILTLRVASEGNLSELNPHLPQLDGLATKLLDGPIARTDKANNNRIINEFHYLLTPLREGTLSIPIIEIDGRTATAGNPAFNIASSEPFELTVKPANNEVFPWLPLNTLVVQAYLSGADNPEAGKPITLTINASAVGATGHQLPSLQQQLQKAKDFRIYRESIETTGKLSPDRKRLMGARIERFTLVPQHGGKLQIPALEIPWWNVDRGSAEVVHIPIRQIIARGEKAATDNPITDLFPGATPLLLWLPLLIVLLITIGFWVLSWLRNKHFVQVVVEEMSLLFGFIAKQFRAFTAWLSPIRRLQKLRQIFISNLPRSLRLWFCVKVVDSEDDLETWNYMLRFLANKHLNLSPQLPLTTLGSKLAQIHGSNPHQMNLLMHELESAIYNNQTIQFDQWKKRFRRQLRPSLFSRHKKALKRTQKLPPLNPNIS